LVTTLVLAPDGVTYKLWRGIMIIIIVIIIMIR
jgi:hypothetical protein